MKSGAEIGWRVVRAVSIAAMLMTASSFTLAQERPDNAEQQLWNPETPYLEVQETRHLPFDRKESFACLGEGWRNRWWGVLTDINECLWSTSITSDLSVTVLRPRDLLLSLELCQYAVQPGELPPQEVRIVWNERPVGVCTFAKEDGWTIRSFSFVVPKHVQSVGANKVTFLSKYAVSPAQLGLANQGNDRRSFGLMRLTLADPTGGGSVTAPTVPDPDRRAVVFESESLVQRADSVLKIPVRLPPGSSCTFEVSVGTDSDSAGRVHVRRDDPQDAVQEEVVTFEPPIKEIQQYHVNLRKYDEEYLELILDTVDRSGRNPESKVRWLKPRLVFSGAPATAVLIPANEIPAVTRADCVVLILLDACRADALGCYGYFRDTSPNLDRLAAEGLVFERAYSAAPYTYSSTWSLLTSLFPFQHGSPLDPYRPSESAPLLQKSLRDAGIITGLVSANPWFASNRIPEGFDEFITAFERVYTGPKAVRDPSLVTDQAIDFMRRHRSDRFFLYAHYMQPHEPYFPAPAYVNHFAADPGGKFTPDSDSILGVNFGEKTITREELLQLRARYDECLLQVDAEIEKLRAAVAELGLDNHTVFVVTADHGESFLEHGVVSHNLTVYEEVTHIPLILSGKPLAAASPARVRTIVRNIDLFPTVCALMEAPAPEEIQGRNLLNVLSARQPQGEEVLAFAQATFDRNPLEAYWWDRYKLIRDDFNTRIQVYDLVNDPREMVNLMGLRPVFSDYLSAVAQAWRRDHSGSLYPPRADVEIAPDTADRLRAVGYL